SSDWSGLEYLVRSLQTFPMFTKDWPQLKRARILSPQPCRGMWGQRPSLKTNRTITLFRKLHQERRHVSLQKEGFGLLSKRGRRSVAGRLQYVLVRQS